MSLSDIYQTPLGLLTDLYQITMCYGYWKLGRADRQAVFHLYFREHPFAGGFTVAAGLDFVLELVEHFRLTDDDIGFLATLQGNDNQPLFDDGFLDYWGQLRLEIDIDAVEEGTIVFPREPLLRVTGPLLQCQMLETVLLNLVNFQTLIATKAARICRAAQGEPVLEFGLRRAQGIDGALSASRAAYIGGCAATSNVLAGKLFGIPVRGTHAHSWVMSFDDELTAFDQYAQAMPNNCVFLVDTYDTLDGVRHAVRVGKRLREQGHRMVGIRLDSGELGKLSIEARRLLDEAGLQQSVIVGSNDLDEYRIEQLKRDGATIVVWGVGTRLVTGYDQPALGGVYKMGAIQRADGRWEPKLKVSDQAIKSTIPGKLQVRRFIPRSSEHDVQTPVQVADTAQAEDLKARHAAADMIYNELQAQRPEPTLVDFSTSANKKRHEAHTPNRCVMSSERYEATDLLIPVVRGGQVVYDRPALEQIRERTQQQLALFSPKMLRLDAPSDYLVGLEEQLVKLQEDMRERALSDHVES